MSVLEAKRRELYRQGVSQLGRKKVTRYDPQSLRLFLLGDHRRSRADTLQWVVAAVVRIAERERKDVESVWRELNDQARAETGMEMSPLHA